MRCRHISFVFFPSPATTFSRSATLLFLVLRRPYNGTAISHAKSKTPRSTRSKDTED